MSDNITSTDFYVDETKKARIEIGINTWKERGGIGTLVYPARFGKTYTGILLIRKVLLRTPNVEIFIGTKNAISKQQWENQIKSEFPKFNIHVETYSTIIKRPPKDRNGNPNIFLFIADEIHNLFSDEFKLILGKHFFNYKFILGLTATPPVNPDRAYIYNKVCPTIDVITNEEAIDNNWICDYNEINVALTLTPDEQERYVNFTHIMAETIELFKNVHKAVTGEYSRFLFNSIYDAIQSCYSGKRFRTNLNIPGYITAADCRNKVASAMGWDRNLDMSIEVNRERDLYWNPTAIEERVKIYMNIQNKRHDIISSSPTKWKAVRTIYRHNQQPAICYNDNIPFADTVADIIDSEFPNSHAISYHTKSMSKQLIDFNTGYPITTKKGDVKLFGLVGVKKYIIENFKNGKIKFISAVNALDESLDLPLLSLVICTSGTINPIEYKQRISRGNTLNSEDADKVATIYNLYFEDFYIQNPDGSEHLVKSRDKTKLLLRQKDSSNITWLKIEDICNI